MRWLQSLLVALLAAGLTLLGVWLVMLWSGAGAPSLTDFGERHPGFSAAFGMLSMALALVSALAQRRKHKSR